MQYKHILSLQSGTQSGGVYSISSEIYIYYWEEGSRFACAEERRVWLKPRLMQMLLEQLRTAGELALSTHLFSILYLISISFKIENTIM